MRGMNWAAAAAAAMVALGAGTAGAEQSRKIDCGQTGLSFDAPGYELSCQDASQDSVSVGEGTISVKIFTLHAVSQADSTFLDVVDDHILGSTRVFYHKTRLESDIGRYYSADFSQWGGDEDVGHFTAKSVTANFKDGSDPMDCIAFRRLGGRRFEGVGGMTVGLACSMQGRDHALAALKHLADRDD